MYDLYKPLRNELRQRALIPSLEVVWAWMQHLQFDKDFPPDIEIPPQIRLAPPGPTKGIYEWELATLAKEVIINSSEQSAADFRQWCHFSAAVNKLKKMDNDISARYDTVFREHIFIEMYRHAHHQFGWQQSSRLGSVVTRYLKIFSYPELDSIVQQKTGLDSRSLYSLGLSTVGHFLARSKLELPLRLELPGITPDHAACFYGRYAIDLMELRRRCADAQSFDEDFIYGFNPLVEFPLVAHMFGGNATVLCPVPPYLMRRFTEGVYYDILDAKGFDLAFGSSFQSYVGEVLGAANSQRVLTILKEEKYRSGKNIKDSVDWIASDDTGELFIECKTKRIRNDAKIALRNQEPLNAELAKLAKMVAQVYKTLADAMAGNYSHWQPDSRPIFPIVVTLEEWYVFGHKLADLIDAHVRAEFIANALDEQLLDHHPFTVCSVSDFERLMPLIALRGVSTVMDAKVRTHRRLWLLHGALNDAFQEDYKTTRVNLFPDALDRISADTTAALQRE